MDFKWEHSVYKKKKRYRTDREVFGKRETDSLLMVFSPRDFIEKNLNKSRVTDLIEHGK